MKRASRAKTALGVTRTWKIAAAQIPVKRYGREERITMVLRDGLRYRKRAEKQLNPPKAGRDSGRGSRNTGSSRGRRDFED